MTYTPWTVTAEIAYDCHPRNPPGSWTSLGTPRMFSIRRGKQDRLSTFEPGSATVTFDNGDFDLDQLRAGTALGDGHALPWTPFRIKAVLGGTTKYLFVGYTLDGFTPEGGRGGGVVVELTDWMGWAANQELPGSLWGAWVAAMQPEQWLPGNASSYDVLRVGDYVWNEAKKWSGYDHFEWSAGTLSLGGSQLAPSSESLELFTSASIVSPDDIAQSATWTVMMWVSSTTHATWRVGSANWEVLTDVTTGHLVANVWVGAALETVSIAVDHDDGAPHLFQLHGQTTTGSRFIYLASDLGGSTIVPANNAVSGGGVVAITGTTNGIVGDYVYRDGTRPAAPGSTAYAGYFAEFVAGTCDLWFQDTCADRLAHLGQVADVTMPTLDVTMIDETTRELDTYVPPSTLADGVRRVASSWMGDAYVLRDGTLRIRDSAYVSSDTAAFRDPQSQITDDPAASGSPLVIRPGDRARTGTRLDKHVNEVIIVVSRSRPMSWIHSESQARYGKQSVTFTAEPAASRDVLPPLRSYLADAAPVRPEIDGVTLMPWGNQDLTDWAFETLELETTHMYREATPDNTEIVNAGVRVIGETWDWSNGTGWKIRLRLAFVSYMAEVLIDIPVGYWMLDDVTGTEWVHTRGWDAGGEPFTGVTQDPVAGPGAGRLARHFSGVGTPYNAGAAAIFALGDEGSLECWAKWTSTAAMSPAMLGDAAGSKLMGLMTTAAGEIAGYSNGSVRATSTSVVNDDEWHHIVVVHEPAGAGDVVQSIFVDGAFEASSAVFTPGTGDGITIGSTYAGGFSFDAFTGDIAQVAVYSQALSAERIRAHYRAI